MNKGPEQGAEPPNDPHHRYKLWRIWDPDRPKVLYVMLNPSKADAFENDRTISKCIKLAKAMGYGGLYVGNLFALRATNPMVLHAHLKKGFKTDPRNQQALADMRKECHAIIAGWGIHGSRYPEEVARLLERIGPCQALRITKTGNPSHPLYLPMDVKPVRFTWKKST